MPARDEPRTLYLHPDRVQVTPEGEALRLQRPGRSPEYVPIRRIGRVVVQSAREIPGLLEAGLALARAGIVVHFQTPSGHPVARLQPAQVGVAQPARELAALIDAHPGLGPYHWWRDVQRRHAWSLVFRRTPQGDFAAGCRRLEAYLRHMSAQHWVPDEIEALDGDLRTWLQAELHGRGWQLVCQALAARGVDLEADLGPCLYLTLLWHFVRWRRQQPPQLPEPERLRFFELQTVGATGEQLYRHLRALSEEYHRSWHRLERVRQREREHG